ncbi:MAG TPA: PAS domain S-box protein, partial [Thermoanaerobaculia bacterium]|nr:PAS domain S-box protein [Thermoanaerobaculia bacterium]
MTEKAGDLSGRLADAEARLRGLEEQYRDVVAFAPIGIYRSTQDGRILSANAAFARMLGRDSVEEVLRLEMARDVYFDPADRARLLEIHRGKTAATNAHVRLKRRDGSPFWAGISFRHATKTSGETLFFEGFVTDIDDRVRAEEELRKTKDFLERAQEVARIGGWESDPSDSGRLAWSKETCRIFGIDPAAFDGRVETFFAHVHPDDVAAVRAASRDALDGRRHYRVDHRIVRPDGRVRWVREEADVRHDAAGRPVQMVGTCQDITERKKLEDELRQAQKMEAVGRLAGGVAHDFNNILTAVLGYVGLLEDRVANDPDAKTFLEEVKTAAERAARLTGQLLAFGRRQVLQLEVLSANDLVSDLREMLQRLVGDRIAVRFLLDERAGSFRADPSQVEQVLVNLAVNAKDAMPNGGTMTVRTSFAERSGATEASMGMPGGRYAVLEVSDTGAGMDPETRAHAFEPFYTTKATGRGPGLGLATVYGIVRQSDGFVFVESEPGEGTTFRIFFPAVESETPAEEPAEPAQRPTAE